MTDYMIETAQLCCRIGRRYLLRDVNWQVERGQHYCVFGLNGCGKNTLRLRFAGRHGFAGVSLKASPCCALRGKGRRHLRSK